MSDVQKKLDLIWAHIEEVQRNGKKLIERLVESGDQTLALQLAKNVLVHDQSKFQGIEWDNLIQTDDREQLAHAVHHHNHTNPHHPEYWGGIKTMPLVYVAEMVCDWKARSTEFGSSLQDWIDNQATKRYNFTKRDRIYKDINRFVKLLLEPPFQKLP
jgi:hypothetical protein